MKKISFCFLILTLTVSIATVLVADSLIVADFDKTPGTPFKYNDDKGSIFEVNSSYSEKGRNRFLGIGYDIVKDGWAGYGFGFEKLDVSAANRITFMIKGGLGGETFDISIKDSANNEKRFISTDYFDVSKEWRKVSIPLSAFKGVNTSSLINLHFGFNKNHGRNKIYLDDIAFETEARVGVEAKATRSAKVLIDGFERVNPYNMYITIEGGDSELNLTSSRIVHDGDYSMELEYKLETVQPWGTFVAARCQTIKTPLDWSGVKDIKIWVKGDGSDNIFRINLIDGSGEIYTCDDIEVLSKAAWEQVVMPIEKFVLSEKSIRSDKKLDINSIAGYEIVIAGKSGTDSPGAKTSYGRVYVDHLYITGIGIKVVTATPPDIYKKLGVAIQRIGNVDFTGVLYTEYFNSPEEKGRLSHYGKIKSNIIIDNYSGIFEIASQGQNFGEAAYYNLTSSGTSVESRTPSVEAPNIQVMANNISPNVSNITCGNLWVDYSPYTFTPVWGYKGLTAEGDYNRVNYHTFFIKGRYETFTFGSRMKTFWKGIRTTVIGVYSEDSAKIPSSDAKWQIEKTAKDFVYTAEFNTGLFTDRLKLTGIYGYNEYHKYAEVDYSADPYSPVYNYTLQKSVSLGGGMWRGRLELTDPVLRGLGIRYEYRDVDENFKPKYRQDPDGFDDSTTDQYGHNAYISQRYKGLVVSYEYDELHRKTSSKYFRFRDVYGIGYYGVQGMDISCTYESKKDKYDYTSDRSEFHADNRDDELSAQEVYIRNQLTGNISVWFKIRRELYIWRASNTENETDSMQTKLEYFLTGNAKLFAEYKVTNYPNTDWEPQGWPFDDNFFKISFELLF
ncbi:MAG: CIA30 family protein [Elusimicrobia bacterium]|nr:CIA30 family protein [Elusimicrobiota bacterium]